MDGRGLTCGKNSFAGVERVSYRAALSRRDDKIFYTHNFSLSALKSREAEFTPGRLSTARDGISISSGNVKSVTSLKNMEDACRAVYV